MIDKLDFRIEPEIPFTSEFESVYRRIRSRAQPTDYYMEVLNLRQYGIGAILHLHCRFNANHKVELLQTARMPVGAMAREVEKIFDCQAQELSLARVDLASDVPGITVGWFRDHMRVKHKRSMREIAARTNEAFANGGTTLYFGGGSDIVRVYDKIAQLQHQSGRIGRGGPSQYTNCMESGGLPTSDEN